MIVQCIANSGASLSAKQIEAGNTFSTVFHIRPGSSYPVLGMLMWKHCLMLLIYDENKSPGWYPIELFAIKDSSLPQKWEFALFPQGDKQAIWGYHELVKNEQHYIGIIERRNEDLELLFQKYDDVTR